MSTHLSAYVGVMLFMLTTACQRSSVQPSSTPTTQVGAPATAIPIRLTGRPVKGDRPEVYRVMEDGRLRHISDLLTLNALAYQLNDVTAIAPQRIVSYALGLPLTRWITSPGDPSLYFLQKGKRYPIPDTKVLRATGGSPLDVSLLQEDFLNSFPIATDPILGADSLAEDRPRATAAVWSNNRLWVARDNGEVMLRDTATSESVRSPGQPVIDALTGSATQVQGASQDGIIWQFDASGNPPQRLSTTGSWLSGLASDGDLWYADVNHYAVARAAYHVGRGLIHRSPNGQEQVYALDKTENDPLKSITALALDSRQNVLWAGTHFAGLLRLDLKTQGWTRYDTFNSKTMDNAVTDLKLAPDGTLWLAMPAGIARFNGVEWTTFSIPGDLTDKGALSLAITDPNNLWVSGENYVGPLKTDGTWQTYSAFDNPLFLDRFGFVVLDAQNHPWFVGDRHIIHLDEQSWTAYDIETNQAQTLDLNTRSGNAGVPFPSPETNYLGWLKAWPRPTADNGRGMHFLVFPSGDTFETQQQIAHLKEIGAHWVLVNYTNHAQLLEMAPLFVQAGMMVIWRPYVRPYQDYSYWVQDITFLRSLGIPPYLQVYNEPSLGQEWEDAGKKVDQAVYLAHLLPAIRAVYEAGGYVGLQEIDPTWLRVVLQALKEQHSSDVFQRLFFIPHAYGYNHPPEFDLDINGVLGFREYARVFEDEIGFVPMMIAGEGGWRPGEAQDIRYPMVTQTLHRDYSLAVFNWFSTGQLSNGEPLPDYLFAFCPWILSDPTDPAAWFDSATGDRLLAIQAVKTMSNFERKFSWDKKP